ncbi:NADH dehydrogenase [ubiquinone] 1 alpha subcomplex assembly factor 3 [Pocillopora verrucosa]|uniref:NADH dehydrogenase [ubiquinone] 1 alpha subcomplex assembly factor 3 n=1 Tax=Pocillopora verrucosa TaxID=203993 RepID=UPI0027979E10|nr:NADH dehydrogenase [ubiquinone] 1 alpha subcomplex assembly factor 3-like [Pocillopora verrucosa]
MANALLCIRTCRHLLGRPISRIPRRLKQHGIEKEPMQSTVTFITDFKDKESLINSPPYVMSYSTRGFTVKDIKVFGSVVIFPSAFYHWRIKKPEDITADSLTLFTIMEPPIEIVVVGTGEKIIRLPPEINNYMKKHNILLEVQDTPNATATFNFLLEEQRLVGAAFIPPQTLRED